MNLVTDICCPGRSFSNNGEMRFRLDGDAEAAGFNPTVPDQLIVSTERGTVSVFDVRMNGSGSTGEGEALFSWYGFIYVNRRLQALDSIGFVCDMSRLPNSIKFIFPTQLLMRYC